MELSALVPDGTGGNWLVDIFDRSTDTWTNIGDLSSAGDDWTLVSLTLQGSDLTIYLDANFGNEMLVRVITNSRTEQVRGGLVPGACAVYPLHRCRPLPYEGLVGCSDLTERLVTPLARRSDLRSPTPSFGFRLRLPVCFASCTPPRNSWATSTLPGSRHPPAMN